MKTFSTFLSEAQSSSERAFLDNFYQRARRLGASDIDAKVIASQAALETGWGKSPSGQYNYFGQKAGGSERGTEKGTQEFGGGRMYSTSARFKDYDSLDSAISDRIKKWNYKTTGATDVSDATRRLMLPGGSKIPGTNQTSHGAYATDPDYVQKISSIASRFGDSPSRSSAPKPTSPQKTFTKQVIQDKGGKGGTVSTNTAYQTKLGGVKATSTRGDTGTQVIRANLGTVKPGTKDQKFAGILGGKKGTIEIKGGKKSFITTKSPSK